MMSHLEPGGDSCWAPTASGGCGLGTCQSRQRALRLEMPPPAHLREVRKSAARSNGTEFESKTQDWLKAGVRVVLVVDPQTKTICEYRSPFEARVHQNGTIDLRDILPEFELDVVELFA